MKWRNLERIFVVSQGMENLAGHDFNHIIPSRKGEIMNWQDHCLNGHLALTTETSQRIYRSIAEIDAVKNS